jgi:hypothetical protein
MTKSPNDTFLRTYPVVKRHMTAYQFLTLSLRRRNVGQQVVSVGQFPHLIILPVYPLCSCFYPPSIMKHRTDPPTCMILCCQQNNNKYCYIPDKLLVPQLVTQFYAFYWNARFKTNGLASGIFLLHFSARSLYSLTYATGTVRCMCHMYSPMYVPHVQSDVCATCTVRCMCHMYSPL